MAHIIVPALVTIVFNVATGLWEAAAEAEEAEMTAGQLETRAEIAEQEYAGIAGQAETHIRQRGEEGERVVGEQLGGFAVGGAEVGSGSPLIFMAGTAAKAQQDVGTLETYYDSLLKAKQSEISQYYAQHELLAGESESPFYIGSEISSLKPGALPAPKLDYNLRLPTLLGG